MRLRRTWRGSLVAAIAIFGMAVSTSPVSASNATVIKTFEKFNYVPGPGGGLVLNWGFNPRTAYVKSGSTVRWVNTGRDEPHTASIASWADVPKTIDELFGCFRPDRFCGRTLAAHDPGNDGRPPFHSVVNAGKPGVNMPGDSRLILPGQAVTATVTARPGTLLHYICAIHPWMQAKLRVT